MLTLPTGAVHQIIWNRNKAITYYSDMVPINGRRYLYLSTLDVDYNINCHYCACLN